MRLIKYQKGDYMMETTGGKVSDRRKKHSMKVKDPLYYSVVIVLAVIGIVVGLDRGGRPEEILVFLIFALSMVYMGTRW